MAKKILALAMAIALVVCFAVSASAADNVTTVTTYVDGEASVEVTVSADENANVTYYATKNGTPVFVDQKKVEEGETAVTFDFVTAYSNVGSDVVIGYTGGAVDKDESIPAAQYTITCNGEPVGSANHGEGTTVTFANPAGAHEALSVKVAGEDVPYELVEDGAKISVTLSNVVANVEITVSTEEIEIPDYDEEELVDIVDAAAIVVTAETANDKATDSVTGEEVDLTAEVGSRKLTVCGKVLGEFTEYGVLVSATPIEAGKYWAEDFEAAYAASKYVANTKTDGKFAVQLIDTSADGAFVKAGIDYYTAVYAKTAEACYVSVHDELVKAN